MATETINEKDLTLFAEKSKKIFQEIRKDVIGQSEVVEFTVLAIVAGGNVLLEGAPGLGKTRLVRSLGRVFDLPFSRIQFTPDLMPADVTGTSIIVKGADGNSSFSFQKGPIFSNIVLADEINRATPKTQSALLEAMQEHTVTVMGQSRKLDEPFFVLATQNPIEQDGTYPLPEAQMDRFMFKLIVPFPSVEDLERIVNVTQKTMDETASAVCTGEELLNMRRIAKGIPVADEVMRYAMLLVAATYPDNDLGIETATKYLRYGASPRAAQAIITAAKVRALLHARYNVSYEDIDALAVPALRHRIKLSFEAVTGKMSSDAVVKNIIAELKTKMPAIQKARDEQLAKAKKAQAAQAGAGPIASPGAPRPAPARPVPSPGPVKTTPATEQKPTAPKAPNPTQTTAPTPEAPKTSAAPPAPAPQKTSAPATPAAPQTPGTKEDKPAKKGLFGKG